ncbi:MAG: PilZ domain-containing protein [Desulfobacterales bacterium]|nr:PilZ domain-containing protein [Desulfobacterales bacterium]
MTENSIEFQPMPGANSIRHAYRVPASEKDDIQAILYRRTYSVTNISAIGIAIHSNSCLEFESGQIIEDAELKVGSLHMTHLRGKVIHCSVHDSGDLQFGIEWLDMKSKDRERLEESLGQFKARALEDKNLPEDQAQKDGGDRDG